MIVIIVEGGAVTEVYSDNSKDEIKIVDFDDAAADDTGDEAMQELHAAKRDMHQVY